METSPITGEFIELQSLVKDVNGTREFFTLGLKSREEGGLPDREERNTFQREWDFFIMS